MVMKDKGLDVSLAILRRTQAFYDCEAARDFDTESGPFDPLLSLLCKGAGYMRCKVCGLLPKKSFHAGEDSHAHVT